jgi:predicted nucleic acid-binding protein
MESWRTLFERAAAHEVDEAAVREALAAVRDGDDPPDSDGTATELSADSGTSSDVDADSGTSPDADVDSDVDASAAPDAPAESSPARVVADADVLAADLLVGGDARRALDHLREHSWTTLLASAPLLDDAEAVVADLAGTDLAADWYERVEAWCELVGHPAGDHPALATAYRGGAMHLLSYDERLLSAKAGAALGGRLSVSARHPRAFATLFDAESLYREVVVGEYPGPDRDPRN